MTILMVVGWLLASWCAWSARYWCRRALLAEATVAVWQQRTIDAVGELDLLQRHRPSVPMVVQNNSWLQRH
jgi:hypothetical protein